MPSWLHHDHKQFETAIHRCRVVCDDGDWTNVQEAFGNFVSAYRDHVRLEEEALFPMYEEQVGVSTEPTSSLREDHAQIFRLVANIQELISRAAWERVAQDVSLLYRSLIRHHEKEEEIFLPMASDALVSDKEEVVAELKRRAGVK